MKVVLTEACGIAGQTFEKGTVLETPKDLDDDALALLIQANRVAPAGPEDKAAAAKKDPGK